MKKQQQGNGKGGDPLQRGRAQLSAECSVLMFGPSGFVLNFNGAALN